MDNRNTSTEESPRRKAALTTLAIVGFITLILIGIALAIYAARYVPTALNKLGIAGVSLFDNGEDVPELEIITSTTTIPFEPVATSTETIADEPDDGDAGYTAPVTGTGGSYIPPRTITVPVVIPPPVPHGKADFTVKITEIGYCRSDNPDSFRASREVPDGENGGIKFVVSNIGTNNSGRWDFTYELPTSPSLERTVSNQRELGPGDRIEYTLCFTEPRSGNNRDITVEVDTDDDVNESNERNNTDTAEIDIEN